MSIANTIKVRRKELKLNAKTVATAIGVAESTYRDWENGRSIQGEPYIELAKVLELPLSTLLGAEKTEVMQEFLLELALLEKSVKTIRQSVMQII